MSGGRRLGRAPQLDSGYTDLAAAEVAALVRGCIDQVNLDLAFDPRWPAHRFTASSFCTRNSMPTTASGLPEGAAAHHRHKYARIVEALYGTDPAVQVEAQVKFEDGRSGTIRADLRITDARSTPQKAAQLTRKAA
jgi:long-chain acyl-CoA synthetase